MLKEQGYKFKIIKPLCSEVNCHIKGPRLSALNNSTDKAIWVSRNNSNCVILSADTVVVIKDHILGKPKNKKDALRMLCSLNNKTHSVLTAYTVLVKNGNKAKIMAEAIVESKVTFGNFTKNDYVEYVNTDEPMDKAGAYAIQGLGARFIKEVNGSYSNVVGLPLLEVMNSLKKAGVTPKWK
jgi:septum formation protein